MSSASLPPASPPAARWGWHALYARPLPWLLGLVVAHVVVRIAISPALQWDEAEQVLWTQHLQWGYGAQPPLYTWLQWGVFQALGPGIPALALLKHALIALTCTLMWLAGRELLGPRGAWWSAVSLLLLPPLGWYAISDYTHTVLVTTMTCGAWWLLLRIVRRGGSACQREFAALGLVCGCGMLAKYNFALVIGPLLVALLAVPAPRRALLARGWWWTVAIGLLITAPHGWWLLGHWHLASAGTLRKMDITPEIHFGLGLFNLLMAVLATLALWALVALAAFGSGWWRRPAAARPAAPADERPLPWLRPVFGIYLGLVALALLAMVFGAGVTSFKDRWMLPLLAPVPLMAFALRPGLQADPRGNRFTALALALVLALLVAAGAQPFFTRVDHHWHALNQPVARLAQALQGAGYDGRSRIIAADVMLAGALRTRFPGASAQSCSDAKEVGDVAACVADGVKLAEDAGLGWLVISRADRVEPGWWELALARVAGSANLPRGRLYLPYYMAAPDLAPARFDFVWHPPGRQP